MGFFKSLNDLNKQAKEIDKTFDPAKQMKDGMASMQAATDMMAQQTAAANIAATGVDAKGLVVAVRQTGAMINMQPAVEIDLNVMPEGLPPYPVTYTGIVEQIFLSKAVAGAAVALKVDANDPGMVWINWAQS